MMSRRGMIWGVYSGVMLREAREVKWRYYGMG
jgi:hypothetical protein